MDRWKDKESKSDEWMNRAMIAPTGGGAYRPAGVIWVVGREIGNFVLWGAV